MAAVRVPVALQTHFYLSSRYSKRHPLRCSHLQTLPYGILDVVFCFSFRGSLTDASGNRRTLRFLLLGLAMLGLEPIPDDAFVSVHPVLGASLLVSTRLLTPTAPASWYSHRSKEAFDLQRIHGGGVYARALGERTTLLHAAAYFGSEAVARLLLEHGASVQGVTLPTGNQELDAILRKPM